MQILDLTLNKLTILWKSTKGITSEEHSCLPWFSSIINWPVSFQFCSFLFLPCSAPGLSSVRCSCTGAPVEVYVLRKGVSWTASAINIPAKRYRLEGLQSRDPEKHSPAGLRDNSCQMSVAVCKKSWTGIWLRLCRPCVVWNVNQSH